MNKGLLVISAMAVALSLACSKSDDGKKGGGGSPANIPDDISQEKIVQGKALTEDEKLSLQKAFKGGDDVPDVALFLKGDEPAEKKEEVLKKVGELKGRKKDLYNEMLKNCKVSGHSDNNNDLSNAKTGDTFALSEATQISGADCAMNVASNSKGEIRINFSNVAELREAYERTKDEAVFEAINMNMSMNVAIKQQRTFANALVKETGVKSFGFNGSAQGLVDVTKDMNKNYITIQVDGKIVLQDNSELKLSGKAETLTKNENSKSSIKLEISLKDINATLQMRLSNGKAAYYVNGNEMSEADFKSIFGEVGDIVGSSSLK